MSLFCCSGLTSEIVDTWRKSFAASERIPVLFGGVDAQIRQVFDNLAAVAEAAGGGLADVVKITVYLSDLGNFARVNEIMAQYFDEPYPARAAIGVAGLPKCAVVEMDAILVA